VNPRLGFKLGWRAFVTRSGVGGGRFLWSSSLALALGLVPLVVVLSIADGMIDSISSRTIETLLSHEQAWPVTLNADQDLQEKLSKVAGFRAAYREQSGFGLAYSQMARLGVTLRGEEDRWAGDPGVRRFLSADSGTLVFPDQESLWVGREASVRLGVKVGDQLKVLTTRTGGTLRIPRVTTFTVRAIVSVGYQELDRLWVFLPVETSVRLLDPLQNPVFFGIKSDRPLSETPAFLKQVREVLGRNWQVYSWQTTGRSQFLNYQATRFLLLLVMALIVLVAGINIATSMVTLVRQRREETAILKALGASVGLVRFQFLVLGLCAGLLGTLAGIGLGVLAAVEINALAFALEAVLNGFSALRAWLMATDATFVHLLNPAYYLETLPVKFDLALLALVAAGSVTLAVVASAVPAFQASRQRPIEVLRRV